VILNRKGKPVKIKKYERHFAHKIIEEFMILANESVSKMHEDLPFLYRTHGTPIDEKTESLRNILAVYGIELPHSNISPKVIQDILEKIKDTPKAAMLQKLVLRSLSKAEYSYENVGHFGLALTHYSHFTSPIRRYPDLQIHRIMKEKLAGTLTKEKIEYYASILEKVGQEMTEKEINAEKLEYAVIDLKKAEFMKDRIGEKFT
jgi:ribonuclease R